MVVLLLGPVNPVISLAEFRSRRLLGALDAFFALFHD